MREYQQLNICKLLQFTHGKIILKVKSGIVVFSDRVSEECISCIGYIHRHSKILYFDQQTVTPLRL